MKTDYVNQAFFALLRLARGIVLVTLRFRITLLRRVGLMLRLHAALEFVELSPDVTRELCAVETAGSKPPIVSLDDDGWHTARHV